MMQPNNESSHYRNGNSGTPLNGGGEGTLVPVQNGMAEWAPNRASPAGPSEGGAQIEPKALLNAFRRRWFLAITVGLLCGGTAAATVYLLVPPNYVAEASVYIKATPPSLLGGVNNGGGNYTFDTFKKTQMYRAISRMVLDTALNENVKNRALQKIGYKSISDLPLVKAQPDLMQIDWLLSKLSVAAKQEEFFSIKMEHSESPMELAELVNAITHVYLRDIANEDKAMQRQRIAQLKQLNIDQEKKVKDLRQDIKLLSNRLGVGTPEAITYKQMAHLREMSALQEQYFQYRTEKANLEIYHKTLEQGEDPETAKDDVLTDELLDAHIEAEPDLRALVLQSEAYKHSIQELESTLRDDEHPLLASERKKLNNVEKSIAEMRTKLRPLVKEKIRKDLDNTQLFSKLPIAEQIKNLDRHINELEKKLEKEDSFGKKLTVDSYELERMEADKSRLIASVDEVTDRVRKLEIELDAEDRIKLNEEAQVPRLVDMATLYKKSAMAGLGVFGLLVAGIVWFEFQAKRIDSLSDVTSGLSLRIMGALPQMPRWANKKTTKGKAAKSAFWHSVLTESIDAARTVLIRDANVESTRLVMVASAISGEGKTTLSSHLAASLARVGRNTILVDCDFRKANIHKVFGVEAKPGLSEVLLGTANLEDAIRTPSEDGPSILPAGEFNSQLLAALASDGLGAIFQELKKKYEFVVVDSSPILPVTDSLMVAQHIDAVILSIRRDISRKPKVSATRDKLAMLGVPILGAVVIGLDGDSYGYRGGYYGYGSRYGYGYQYNRTAEPTVKQS